MNTKLTSVKQNASDPSEERNLILKDGKTIAEVVHNDMEWEEFEENTKELVDRYNAHEELKQRTDKNQKIKKYTFDIRKHERRRSATAFHA